MEWLLKWNFFYGNLNIQHTYIEDNITYNGLNVYFLNK